MDTFGSGQQVLGIVVNVVSSQPSGAICGRDVN